MLDNKGGFPLLDIKGCELFTERLKRVATPSNGTQGAVVGLRLQMIDGRCLVDSLAPGYPADLSGRIHPGQRIITINRALISAHCTLEEAAGKLTGEVGSIVRLTLTESSEVWL